MLTGQGRLGINRRSEEARGDLWRKAAGRWQAELGARVLFQQAEL